MKSLGAYLKVSFTAILVGLPVGSIMGGLGFSLYSLVTGSQEYAGLGDAIQTGLFFSLFAVLIGFLPALLYGAPLHALLARRGVSNCWSSAALGAVPGAVLLIRSPGLGLIAMYFGVCIAIASQWFANRRKVSAVNAWL